MAGIVLKPRARMLHGHDWVYASEVLKTFGDPQPGGVISIKDGRDRLLGSAIYNPKSQIVARRISHRRLTLDQDFLRRRLERAIRLRRSAEALPDVCRLVWSEADGLPGVVADRYRDVIVLQTNTLAFDLLKNPIAFLLLEMLEASAVVERNDSAARISEGLPTSTGLLAGTAPGLSVVELNGAKFQVDFLGGQKTGLYLDQSENARTIAGLCGGRSVLDAFSNQGGFALPCAASGALSVTAIESGSESVARLRRNAALNRVAIEILHQDVFNALPELQRAGRRFDVIILDPPSFTRARGKINDALRGYRELHRLAAPLLTPDGLLATFCCSHHVTEAEFLTSVAEGFFAAKRSAHIIQKLGQARDHPVALNVPETSYLKGLLLAARPSI